MKKHHLFLLIVCLLLVASLAFPQVSEFEQTVYQADDLNEIPAVIVANDRLYIKKVMYTPRNTHVQIEIFKVKHGHAPEKINYHLQSFLIKGTNDDVPEDYYLITLPVGKYMLHITCTPHFGTMAETRSVVNHELEVIHQTNKKEIHLIRQGDDGTY